MQLKLIQLADYKPHPMNSNTHPQEQITELSNSHEMFGQYKNVVVWNGYYLAGHGYKEAAEARGETELYAVDMSHLSAEEATALIEADNETARMSIIDEVKRAEALASLSFNPPGFDDDKMAALSAGLSGIGEGVEDGIVIDDPMAEWEGMPEFENEANGSMQKVIVHLATVEDREKFAELMGQNVTDKTKSIWYPKLEIEDRTKYIEENDQS